MRAISVGSSPLARGLPHRIWGGTHLRRIIPARAGFTLTPSRRSLLTWDHPRSRGVYLSAILVPVIKAGSSPLARGLQSWDAPRTLAYRIIPARAGFTSAPTGAGRRRRDHPRSRGVYGHGAAVELGQVGIIPARAGFTTPTPRTRSRTWDHPRSRGVYIPRYASLPQAEGSSPLARGLQGDTVTSKPQSGSSPLARGLQRSEPPPVRLPRIIPARAGFTRHMMRSTETHSDHPRSRGVYYQNVITVLIGVGSSPLARGLLSIFYPYLYSIRIIPARAGFTAR